MQNNTSTPDIQSQKTAFPSMKELRPVITPYMKSDTRRSLWQLANTIIPYFVMWYLMWLSLSVSYWLTLALAVPAAGFLIRIFIFFHDCGHNSFFHSTRLNQTIGFWLGILAFTPSRHWWHSHAVHHATSGNLDKRGIGDVKTMTVKEYLNSPWWVRVGYRVIRHPLGMLGMGPLIMFLISHRLPFPYHGKTEARSVLFANLVIAAIVVGMSQLIGFKSYVLIQLPILWVAGFVGIWLFYIQHQFQGMYWVPNEKWDYVASALRGASYYRLPRVLQWFTGNIGFHHIHHLSPRIPNYFLDKCYENNEILQTWGPVVQFGKAYPSLFLNLWDEEQQKLISFSGLKRRTACEPSL